MNHYLVESDLYFHGKFETRIAKVRRANSKANIKKNWARGLSSGEDYADLRILDLSKRQIDFLRENRIKARCCATCKQEVLRDVRRIV